LLLLLFRNCLRFNPVLRTRIWDFSGWSGPGQEKIVSRFGPSVSSFIQKNFNFIAHNIKAVLGNPCCPCFNWPSFRLVPDSDLIEKSDRNKPFRNHSTWLLFHFYTVSIGLVKHGTSVLLELRSSESRSLPPSFLVSVIIVHQRRQWDLGFLEHF
jgi:hypothetical protein